jgi:hypothetical protein
MTVDSWSHCSSCKGDIGFGETYYVCSVSTCQRKGSDFRFCSVECWDMHVPTMRHREAWAEENRSPTRAVWEREHPPAPRPAASAPTASAAPAPRAASPAGMPEREILVVVSKMKAYVRARSGMNTSDAFADVLSDWIRSLSDEAIRSAEREGRRTVLDRDLRRPS